MIRKNPKLFISIYAALIVLLLFFLLLGTYWIAAGVERWWLVFFQIRLFSLPFLFYFLFLAFFVGSSVYLFLSIYQRHLLLPIEEKLRLLAGGNIDNPILEKNMPTASSNATLFEMDNDLYMIRMKMREIYTELQQLNSRPQLLNGISKEEILESERHRLARELHDSVSQQLFAAMMMLAALNEQAENMDLTEKQRKQLILVADVVNAAQSEMRALLLHLRPVSLEEKTLKQGIEQLLQELQTKVNIRLKWEIEEFAIPVQIEDQLFRVVQELLSNTLRHAKSSELEVFLREVDQNVLLRVIDDGIGFDVALQGTKAGSYGLLNIRERVTGVGGSLKIISFPKQGTSVEVKIPLIGGGEK